MRILVAGATGSIGIHVVNTAIAMGHQPVTLVRNRRKIKLLPRGTDIFYGDVSIPETLTDLPKDIDAIIFTLGSDGQGRIGARAIDYGGVRNILRIFMDTPVRIALMTTIGVTERLSSWNQRTEVHDWKRRSERLVRASGHIYTIVRPGWFDYNNDGLELYIYRSRRRKLFPIFVNFQIYRLKQVSDMKALLITALFMEFISVNTASAAEEIHHADSKVDDQVLIAE
ncbi:SDR family oxidoreductase [Escherichia coli]|nr:SDR family oxidoreductase [Escherichia coli]EFN7455490.1 SDR family oxidoreductase [Escherichia coli]EFN7513655.1 SDR family oxidoreductase [Escherichia coli]KAF3757597.1 hypothetical protein FM727_002422 [Escherichia coli]